MTIPDEPDISFWVKEKTRFQIFTREKIHTKGELVSAFPGGPGRVSFRSRREESSSARMLTVPLTIQM